MAKIKFIEPKQTQEFPLYAVATDGTLVLFSSERAGTVLIASKKDDEKPRESDKWVEGYYLDGWTSCFIPTIWTILPPGTVIKITVQDESEQVKNNNEVKLNNYAQDNCDWASASSYQKHTEF